MARSLCFEIINEFKKFTKNKIKINFKKRREGDMVKIVANTNKLKKKFKWKPKFNKLNNMIKSFIYCEKKLN